MSSADGLRGGLEDHLGHFAGSRRGLELTPWILLAVMAVFTGSCQPREAVPPGSVGSPPVRQFDPATPFLPDAPYPDEIVAAADLDLVAMRCSAEYFSWTGNDHEFVDSGTLERTALTDPALIAYLQAARELNPEGSIHSIAVCDPVEGSDLVIFRLGPCGGGCAGIPRIALGEEGQIRSVAAVIEPDGDGAYFACTPLQWTVTGLLYLSCLGEGTAILRRVDLGSGEVEVLLRCKLEGSRPACTLE